MELELNSREPIYVQIRNHIEMRILSGDIKEGERMPSVREYAGILKVNPNTIQRVYTELENENLICTQRGIGKFVTANQEEIKRLRITKSREIFKEFIKNSISMGFSKEEILELISEIYEEEENE